MSTNTRSTQNRIDPRPRYFALGVDGDGAQHCYHTRSDTVIVVRNGKREHVEDMHGRSLDGWMAYVADARGWDTRRYGRSIVDQLVSGFEGTDV